MARPPSPVREPEAYLPCEPGGRRALLAANDSRLRDQVGAAGATHGQEHRTDPQLLLSDRGTGDSRSPTAPPAARVHRRPHVRRPQSAPAGPRRLSTAFMRRALTTPVGVRAIPLPLGHGRTDLAVARPNCGIDPVATTRQPRPAAPVSPCFMLCSGKPVTHRTLNRGASSRRSGCILPVDPPSVDTRREGCDARSGFGVPRPAHHVAVGSRPTQQRAVERSDASGMFLSPDGCIGLVRMCARRSRRVGRVRPGSPGAMFRRVRPCPPHPPLADRRGYRRVGRRRPSSRGRARSSRRDTSTCSQ